MKQRVEPKLRNGYEIIRSFDARDWARDFVAHIRVDPSIALDEDTMMGWFANAIMRGWDERDKTCRGKSKVHGRTS